MSGLARQRVFLPGVAADRLKIPADRLEAWEQGESRTSLPQVRRIAELYKRPLAVFYLPRPPAAEEPVHDFRRTGTLRPEPERRSVSLNFTSWNQLDRWLREVEGLRRAA